MEDTHQLPRVVEHSGRPHPAALVDAVATINGAKGQVMLLLFMAHPPLTAHYPLHPSPYQLQPWFKCSVCDQLRVRAHPVAYHREDDWSDIRQPVCKICCKSGPAKTKARDQYVRERKPWGGLMRTVDLLNFDVIEVGRCAVCAGCGDVAILEGDAGTGSDSNYECEKCVAVLYS